jgi:hypothetical protein
MAIGLPMSQFEWKKKFFSRICSSLMTFFASPLTVTVTVRGRRPLTALQIYSSQFIFAQKVATNSKFSLLLVVEQNQKLKFCVSSRYQRVTRSTK